MGVAETRSPIEAGHFLAYLYPRRLASVPPSYYFHNPWYRLQVFNVYEVDGTVN